MPKKKIEVEVSKEAYEVGVAAAELIKGLLAKKPIAEIALAELPLLQAAVDNISAVASEPGEDPGAFARALALPVSDVLSAAFAKKA